MILTVVGLAGVIAYSVCSGSKSIKDFLINGGFIIATERNQFRSIFETNKEYLKEHKISDSNQLEKFCQNDLNRRVLFKSTFFHERACSLNMGEVVKEKLPNGVSIRTDFSSLEKYFYLKQKIKQATKDEINDDTKKWNSWCKTNRIKPYSNSTKPLEDDLIVLCFSNSS